MLSFFDLRRENNTFSLGLKSKGMLGEHYFQPQMKNIRSVKRYSHTFSFQNCFVFHLIMLFLKGFLVLSDLLKPVLKKSGKENS